MRVTCAGPGLIAMRADAWRAIAGHFGNDDPFQAGLVSIGLLLSTLGKNTYLQSFARFTRLPVSKVDRAASSDANSKWEDAHQRWSVRQRFEKVFAAAGADGTVLKLAARPKIVMIDAFVPKPDQDSGSADLFWYMRIFHAFGYQVSFIAAFEEQPLESYADALRRWGVRVQYATDLDHLNHLVLEESRDAQVVLVQRVVVARHVICALRERQLSAKIVFGTVDLHYLREERIAIHERSPEALDYALTLRREELRATVLVRRDHRGEPAGTRHRQGRVAGSECPSHSDSANACALGQYVCRSLGRGVRRGLRASAEYRCGHVPRQRNLADRAPQFAECRTARCRQQCDAGNQCARQSCYRCQDRRLRPGSGRGHEHGPALRRSFALRGGHQGQGCVEPAAWPASAY